MNLTPKSLKEELMSEVEKNQARVQVGVVLYFIDCCNFQKWEVTELFEGGFVAKDDYEEKDFWFDELQISWRF